VLVTGLTLLPHPTAHDTASLLPLHKTCTQQTGADVLVLGVLLSTPAHSLCYWSPLTHTP
jgi:hypothetical protein